MPCLQIIGPVLFKIAIRAVGESHETYEDLQADKKKFSLTAFFLDFLLKPKALANLITNPHPKTHHDDDDPAGGGASKHGHRQTLADEEVVPRVSVWGKRDDMLCWGVAKRIASAGCHVSLVHVRSSVTVTDERPSQDPASSTKALRGVDQRTDGITADLHGHWKDEHHDQSGATAARSRKGTELTSLPLKPW